MSACSKHRGYGDFAQYSMNNVCPVDGHIIYAQTIFMIFTNTLAIFGSGVILGNAIKHPKYEGNNIVEIVKQNVALQSLLKCQLFHVFCVAFAIARLMIGTTNEGIGTNVVITGMFAPIPYTLQLYRGVVETQMKHLYVGMLNRRHMSPDMQDKINKAEHKSFCKQYTRMVFEVLPTIIIIATLLGPRGHDIETYVLPAFLVSIFFITQYQNYNIYFFGRVVLATLKMATSALAKKHKHKRSLAPKKAVLDLKVGNGKMDPELVEEGAKEPLNDPLQSPVLKSLPTPLEAEHEQAVQQARRNSVETVRRGSIPLDCIVEEDMSLVSEWTTPGSHGSNIPMPTTPDVRLGNIPSTVREGVVESVDDQKTPSITLRNGVISLSAFENPFASPPGHVNAVSMPWVDNGSPSGAAQILYDFDATTGTSSNRTSLVRSADNIPIISKHLRLGRAGEVDDVVSKLQVVSRFDTIGVSGRNERRMIATSKNLVKAEGIYALMYKRLKIYFTALSCMSLIGVVLIVVSFIPFIATRASYWVPFMIIGVIPLPLFILVIHLYSLDELLSLGTSAV